VYVDERAAADEEEDEEEEGPPSRASSSSSSIKRARPISSVGEHRLKIRFESLGDLGQIPQTFGRSDRYIPDGLRGTHEVYQERWRFEVRHHVKHFRTSVEWIAENLTSGLRVSKKETLEESIVRETQGRTICNRVLREALEGRAKELEAQLAELDERSIRTATLRDKIKALRPTRCLVGLLFFGLQHKQVQDRMEAQAKERLALTAAKAPEGGGGDVAMATTNPADGQAAAGAGSAAASKDE